MGYPLVKFYANSITIQGDTEWQTDGHRVIAIALLVELKKLTNYHKRYDLDLMKQTNKNKYYLTNLTQ